MGNLNIVTDFSQTYFCSISNGRIWNEVYFQTKDNPI